MSPTSVVVAHSPRGTPHSVRIVFKVLRVDRSSLGERPVREAHVRYFVCATRVSQHSPSPSGLPMRHMLLSRFGLPSFVVWYVRVTNGSSLLQSL